MHKLQVSEGAALRCDANDLVIVRGQDESRLSVGREVALRIAQLEENPRKVDELSTGLLGLSDGMKQLAILTACLQKLIAAGCINPVVEVDGQIVAKMCKKGRLSWKEGNAPEEAVISPHVIATHSDGWIVLDSGLGCALVKILPALAGRVLAGEHLSEGENYSTLKDLLWQAGLLVPKEKLNSMVHTMWDSAELLMMERSNDAAANFNYGATYRYVEECPPLPLLEPLEADGVIELPAVDPEKWKSADEPFSVITERRRSVSCFSPDELPNLNQIAGVLHRSARFQQRFLDDKKTEVGRRPVAAGGALHESDIYIAVNQMVDVAQGLWRYNPVDNTLERVRCAKDPSALVDNAAASTWGNSRPPVTIILVARFARVMWKYEGVGSALILKNAGVMLHALQLAAVAEGLGACALGGNSARLFEDITGLGFPTHAPVGQLVLGVEQKGGPS
ncbi:MAG: SagB family peptide dehydrogenase [Arachnia propionica]|uniref:SagB family peptide dehydrogenase n=1 Tax=Arachnia propionica TaxID=1750 RepID=UPI00270D27AA|nr:SagB family peptide dehydrogenase [Arachnia propionica]